MKVCISLISSDRLDESRRLVRELESTVKSGDVERSDALSKELRKLNKPESCATVPEFEWKQTNIRIRGECSDYYAEFILPPSVCKNIASFLALDDDKTVGRLFSEASARKLHLLQLPYLEE